jgi:hypothetical protein
VRTSTDDGASWLDDLGTGHHRIEVDAASLTGFAASLRAELMANFLPYSAQISRLAGSAPLPERCPWGQAAADLSENLTGVGTHADECARMLNQVLSGGEWLANAAELISVRYQGSDAYAAASATDLADLLWAPEAETAIAPRERGYE